MSKAELIRDLMDDLTKRVGDIKAEAEKDSLRLEGAQRALIKAADSVMSLCVLIDDDVERGKYELETAKTVKSYVLRASQMLIEQSKNAGNQRLAAQGKAQGMLDVTLITTKRRDEEQAKLERAVEVETKMSTAPAPTTVAAPSKPAKDVTEATPRTSEVGTHPGPSLKEERLAEDRQMVLNFTPASIVSMRTPVKKPKKR